MNKKVILLASAFLVVGVAAALTFFFLAPKFKFGPAASSPSPSSIKGPQPQAEIDSLIQESMKKLDESYCQKIENKETQDWCVDNVITTQAVVNKNPELCQTIKTASGKISCEDTILVNQAVQQRKPAICDQLGETWRISQCKEAVTNAK